MEEKRRLKRYPLRSKAMVRWKGEEFPSVVIDYSLNGFSLVLHSRLPISEGEIVDIKVDELSIEAPAVVRWAKQVEILKRIGVEKKGIIEGRMGDYLFGDTIVGLKMMQKTGIININSNDIVKKIYLEKGNAVFAISSDPSDRLDNFLLQRGIINEGQFRKAVEEMKRSGERFGYVLVKLGYMNPSQLFEYVKAHIEEVILSLFTLEDGRFFLEERALPAEELIKVNISSGNVIYYGIKRMKNLEKIARLLPMDSILYFSSNPSRLFQEIRIDESGKRILSCIDNKSTIGDIIKRSGLEPPEAIKSIYGFMSIRLLSTVSHRVISPKEVMDILMEDHDKGMLSEIDEIYRIYNRLGYYGILNVKPDATDNEIKRAFYRAAKRFHPDRHFMSHDESIKEKLNAIFSYINEAYEVLSNPEKRAEYNKKALHRSYGTHRDASPQGLYEKARACFNTHDYEMAEYYIKQAIYYDKGRGFYHFLYGLILIRLNRQKEAKSPLQEAVRLEPLNPDYLAELGWLYLNEGLKVTARDFFERALKILPQHERALMGLASVSKVSR